MAEKLKILVVDDDEDICLTTKMILEMRGAVAVTVNSGFQAIDALREQPYDAVLLDMRMPELNGIETLRRIREISLDVPVIMNSAYALVDVVQTCRREGAYATLRKPVDFDLFFSMLDECTKNGPC